MRRTSRAWLDTIFLLPALSLAACTLYFDDTPQQPLPVPDAGWWGTEDAGSPPGWPDAALPPLVTSITVPLSPAVRERARYIEVTRLHNDRAPSHQIIPISAGASEVTVATERAELLSLSLHQASGQLIDAAVTGTLCPSQWMAQPRRIIEVPVHRPTIQDAIDAAAPGDIVYVHPGTYQERIQVRSGVRLIGAGAARTILDGRGAGQSLIDFSGAADVVIRGFTLRNVGQAQGCSRPDDPFACSGDWYAAAVHANGQLGPQFGIGCPGASLVLAHNVIEDNELGVMLYYFAPAAIRNNLFIRNNRALAFNRLNDNALVVNNTFVDNKTSAIADQDGYLDVVNNIIAGSPVGLEYDREAVYGNDLACNIFFDVANPGEHVELFDAGNEILDPMFRDPAAGDYRLADGSPILGRDCFAEPQQGVVTSPGAYGGFAGAWYEQRIDVADLALMFGL